MHLTKDQKFSMHCSRLIVGGAVLAFLIGGLNFVARGQTASKPAEAFQVLEATIDDIHAALRSKQTTCRALVEQYLKRIEAYDKSGPALKRGANDQFACARRSRPAGRCVPGVRTGRRSPLHSRSRQGSGRLMTCQRRTAPVLFKDFVPERDATIVTRLRKAGAVTIGKSTMGEYASGYLSSLADFRNAYDPKRHASGSSGGTGAGVSADFSTIGIAERYGRIDTWPRRRWQSGRVETDRATRPPARNVAVQANDGHFGPRLHTHGGEMQRSSSMLLRATIPRIRLRHIRSDTFRARIHPSSWGTDSRGARIGVIRQPMDPKTDPASSDYGKVRVVIDRAIADLKALGAEVDRSRDDSRPY